MNTLSNHSELKLSSLGSEELTSHDLKGNIENFIGWSLVPTGLTSPILINGQYAKGTFSIPLATTEGALVASYSRGAKAITAAGGASCMIIKEALQRCPLFVFSSLSKAASFANWISGQFAQFQYITSLKSKYANLINVNTIVEGNHVTAVFEYTTGEAAGQNMVTICTQAICDVIISDAPIKPCHYFVEGNFSGDKKATAKSLHHVRGKRVSAEVVLNKTIINHILKSDADIMHKYWLASSMASIQSGTIGAQGHYANGLAALYLATGQDVACVAESAVGITRMEVVDNDSLMISVTLPSLIVGTVGGGTWLPTQSACLDLLQCKGKDSSKKLAEIAAALVLAGEISIAAALASGHFTKAHQSLGRK